MKQVNCINSKGFKLTTGNTYEVEDVPGRPNRYRLINDAGKETFYSKELFEDIVVEPVVSTLEEVTESIMCLDTRNDVEEEENFKISFTINETEYNFNFSSFSIHGSPISCGIKEVEGLNNFFSNLLTFLEPLDTFEELAQIIAAKFLEFYLEEVVTIRAFVLFSTNISDNANSDIIQTVMDEISISFEPAHNPNSDNDIRLWVVN